MRVRFDRTHWVYVIYGDESVVLYVGMSSQPDCRIKDHKRYKEWFPENPRIDFVRCGNRHEALAAERMTIKKLKPVHNLQLNPRFVRDGYSFVEAA